MKKIIIINGPNLNLLGKRETSIYGSRTFEDFYADLKEAYLDVDLSYFQSNDEGVLIDKLHDVGFSYHGVVLNAGAYTHTSVALKGCYCRYQYTCSRGTYLECAC